MWGGSRVTLNTLADGAAYNPATDTWRPLAPVSLAPRRGHATVWTGQQMIVWGGTGAGGGSFYANGAAYNPATDRWSMIASSPGRFVPRQVWTGSDVLVWGGIEVTDAVGRIDAAATGFRYTP